MFKIAGWGLEVREINTPLCKYPVINWHRNRLAKREGTEKRRLGRPDILRAAVAVRGMAVGASRTRTQNNHRHDSSFDPNRLTFDCCLAGLVTNTLTRARPVFRSQNGARLGAFASTAHMSKAARQNTRPRLNEPGNPCPSFLSKHFFPVSVLQTPRIRGEGRGECYVICWCFSWAPSP